MNEFKDIIVDVDGTLANIKARVAKAEENPMKLPIHLILALFLALAGTACSSSDTGETIVRPLRDRDENARTASAPGG